jgi:WD40 repeat protein
MKSSKSFILFWNYEDLHAIDPLLILTSPLEILVFEFNPKDPSIVIAGTINGQIMMWDLKHLELGAHSNPKKKGKSAEKNQIKEIEPVIMSALQDPSSVTPVTDTIKKNVPSHKAPVLCIQWFPSGLEIEIKKSYSTLIQSPGTEINQFASISSDGQVLLWEKKFLDAHKQPVTDVNN